MVSLTENRPAYSAVNAAYQWIFMGDVKASAALDQCCPICDRNDLGVTFEVQVANSKTRMSLCENCLGKGAIMFEPSGMVLRGSELRHQLSAITVRTTLRTCKGVLRDLLHSDDEGDLAAVMVYFDRNAALSPRHAATLFLALSSAQLDIDPRLFDVQIRSIEHQKEFGRLSEVEKLAVWQVLSPTVRKRLVALGLAPKRYATPQGRRSKPSRGKPGIAELERYGLYL